jgi:hypothetical protein
VSGQDRQNRRTQHIAQPVLRPLANYLQGDSAKRYFASSGRVRDSIEKAMTGAASSEREQMQYVINSLPSFGDDPATVHSKLVALRTRLDTLEALSGGRRLGGKVRESLSLGPMNSGERANEGRVAPPVPALTPEQAAAIPKPSYDEQQRQNMGWLTDPRTFLGTTSARPGWGRHGHW